MRYPPFCALANILVRSEKQEDALAMSGELGHLLDPTPEAPKLLGPAEARLRRFAIEKRWSATALIIDVDSLTLL